MDHLFTLPEIGDGEDKSSPLKNRIRKNYRHVRKWAKRTLTNCFRIYDKEIKEYPLAVDYYDGRFCIHYFPGSRAEEEPKQDLVDSIEEALSSLFNASPDAIFWRTRIRRERTQQYEKAGERKQFFTVYEYGIKFRVNLNDYLDTGLFLDHRETRQMVASACIGKRLLNLFAYTCAFSVQAAAKGASYTKSVDMSNTYTEWAKENFLLNGLPSDRNTVVRADCMKFLDEEVQSGEKYDVIVIDPPTLSRSKKMEGMFDIQQDYPDLLHQAERLLAKGGVIYFSTNSRRFLFDPSLFPRFTVQEISEKTLPIDFHQAKIHRCWKLW